MSDGPYNLPPDASTPGESAAGPYQPEQQAAASALAALRARAAAVAPAPQTNTTAAGPAIAAAPQNAAGNLTNMPATGPPQSWSSRTYHGILNALGGQYDTQYVATPNGVQAQQVAQTPGQQWKRIISGAITGFAGAAQAGTTGPGGTMRGLGGGIQAGYNQRIQQNKEQQDLANTQFEQQQKAAMNTANKSLMASQIAKNTFELSAAKKQSYQSDLAAEANLMQTYESAKDQGAVDLGVLPTFQDVVDKFNSDPTLHDKHVQGQIIPISHVNANGEIDGVHAIWVPKAWQDAKADHDHTVMLPIEWDDKGHPTKYQEHTYGKITGMTNSQMQDADLSMATLVGNMHTSEVENQTKLQKAAIEEKLAPAQLANTWAEAEEHRAEATDKLTQGATDPVLVDSIGKGQMTIDRMAYLLAKKPELFSQVMTKYPDFDSTKVQRYIEAAKDFGSTKPGSAGAALNNGATALKHLQRLQQLNTYGSRIPGTEAYRAYQNQLDTVVGELAKFYGTSDIPGREALKSSLGAFTNRDAAIRTQAQSMGAKFDSYEQSWQNAAPSSVYQSPMPQIDDQAKQARAALDPDYRQRLEQERRQGGVPQPRAPGTPTGTAGTSGAGGPGTATGGVQPIARPSGATGTAKGPDNRMHWTNAQGDDLGISQ